MGLFVLIAFAPSPFKKVDIKNAAVKIAPQTVSKATETSKAETPPITQLEPEKPPAASPAVAETVPTPTPKPDPIPTYPTDHVEIMRQAGISPLDYGAVDYIIQHESGWCPTKSEGEYGACQPYHGHSDYNGYGLCQSTPPGKMALAGADWETNPVTQLKWCTSHALADYGSWGAAYEHWISHRNW